MVSMKRGVSILTAVIALCAPLAAGCSKSSTTDGAVTVFGGDPGVANINTNWFTKFAEKKFGLKFKFNLVPAGDAGSKQPLLLASGHYPDVIMNTISHADALKYGKQGVFLPLNNLIKRYAPNIWHTIQTDPAFKQDVTAPNGKIYGLTDDLFCYHCTWPYFYYINIKLLQKFHLRMPRTTAQFEHVLAVFKQHGLHPLAGSNPSNGGGYDEDIVTFLMNAFVPYNGSTNYFNVTNGHVKFAPAQPGWKQGLEYIHELYSKGYFSKQDLTQHATAVSTLISNEKVGVVPNGAIQTAIPNYTKAGSHYLDWWSMPALKGPQGVQSAAFANPIYNGLTLAITNKTSKANQKKIMRFLNFVWTPKGTQMSLYGPKGKYWTTAAHGKKGVGGGQALFSTNQEKFTAPGSQQNVAWGHLGLPHEGKTWSNGQVAPPTFGVQGVRPANRLSAIADELGHQPRFQYPNAWIPSDKIQQYASEQTNINSYVQQWTDQFIVGQKSIDGDWNSYLSGLRNLKLESYLSTAQKAMRKPLDTYVPRFQAPAELEEFLVSNGDVPALFQKYLIQSGVPERYFTK